VRVWRSRHLVAFLPIVIAISGVTAAPAAAATPRPDGQRRVCPVPAQPGQVACQAVYQLAAPGPAAPAFVPAAARVPGYGPASLRGAYGLVWDSLHRGTGETVAVVDAYADPRVASDLGAYRAHFGLGSCTTASGCLRILNQNGKAAPLPRVSIGWGVEESLDLDMVSAICPRCHLLLVESDSPTNASLGRAEMTAVAKGARFVSNSWSGNESSGQWVSNHYFNHPGDAIVFASGDTGYGTVYPADLPFVTSVGGTTLSRRASAGRPWTETAWGSAHPAVTGGTGSGCSRFTAKPSWQRAPVDISPGGCADRTENDVSAVANPATGVAVYDTYKTHGTWAELGGTSAAAPIVAAVYALAGNPAPRSYPASYPYQHPARRFHDITAGVNGTCPAGSSYLCHAGRGFDAPTGLGTPSGTGGFSSAGTDPVTLADPGGKSVTAGSTVSLAITGLDTRSGVKALAWSATGLPSGLSIAARPGSTSGLITGTVAGTIPSGTVFAVTVTAADRVTRARGTTRFILTVH
jgi:hypothetical protein